ncbi:uncharacterized protein HPF211_1424 [Helicobacter pylori]|nr:uncharacterized protein HPF211_1424 [Helicobacter pylori]
MFSNIFLLFYAIFNKAFLWCEAKKYEQYLIDQKDKEIALKIHECHNEIKKELYKCYSKKQNKIPRTDEFDYWIGCLGLRDFFEPTKDDYIVKSYVLRVIKNTIKLLFNLYIGNRTNKKRLIFV